MVFKPKSTLRQTPDITFRHNDRGIVTQPASPQVTQGVMETARTHLRSALEYNEDDYLSPASINKAEANFMPSEPHFKTIDLKSKDDISSDHLSRDENLPEEME